MNQNQKSKDYCPKCQQQTNHVCLYQETKSDDENLYFNWEAHYEVITCLGCENIQFRSRYSDSEMYQYRDDGNGPDYYYDTKYFPKNLSNHSLFRSIYSLPEKIRIVYTESIEALTNGCYLLSGVGLRAIIEAICLDNNIPGRNLEIKINNLVKNKFITEKDGNRLHSIRFLGNDSVHEMDVPNEEKLRIALDIVEHLIKNLYLMDKDASRHLDTIISKYEDFRNIVLRKFTSTIIGVGEEKSVKEVLGKSFRRIESTYFPNFISQLVNEINNNTISVISIGKIENNQQYFVKK